MLGLLAGAAFAPALGGCDGEGGFPVDLVSDADIRRLGLETWERMCRSTPISRDAGLQQALDAVGRRLLDAAGQDPRDWEMVVFASPEANAFALPGGKIGVFEGMFATASHGAGGRRRRARLPDDPSGFRGAHRGHRGAAPRGGAHRVERVDRIAVFAEWRAPAAVAGFREPIVMEEAMPDKEKPATGPATGEVGRSQADQIERALEDKAAGSAEEAHKPVQRKWDEMGETEESKRSGDRD